MKKAVQFVVAAMLIVGVLMGTPDIAKAATEAQKQAAIASGLAYLAATQNLDGSWPGSSAFQYMGNGYPISTTGATLQAFEEVYYKQGGSWGTLPDYSNVVTKAATYLLNNISTYTMPSASPVVPGFMGTYVDYTGAYWGGGNVQADQTGLALPAIARLTNGINGIGPGTVVGTGPLSGQTYLNVIQRVVDQITWAQNGAASGVQAGGWPSVIAPPAGAADNSTVQWPVVSLMFAGAVPGVTVYPQTATELKKWMNYIQNANGGSGLYSPGDLVAEALTGALLLEMAYAGLGGNKALAMQYLNNNWLNGAGSHDAPWGGNFGNPYAMWSIYRGLESTIGLDDMTTITNLSLNPGDVDNPNHGWNWWESYSDWLVDNQISDGSWSGYNWWDYGLATPWNINILNGTEIPSHGVPEPASLILLGLGLAGIAGIRRKLKK